MKRESRAQWRSRQKSINAGIDAAVAEVKAESIDRYDTARRAARAAEATRVRFTADDLSEATHIRTRMGWYEVVRVNAKTVTVKTGYSWDDRVNISKILEHRTVTA